jgi:hypothetical protein
MFNDQYNLGTEVLISDQVGIDLPSVDLSSLTGGGLSNQYVIVRVKDIDAIKLKKKLKEKKGSTVASFTEPALAAVNTVPRAIVDFSVPFIKKMAATYGVDTEISVSNTPPGLAPRPRSEFFPGVVVGATMCAVGSLTIYGIYRGLSGILKNRSKIEGM